MPRQPTQADRPYHHGDLERTLIDAAIALVQKSGAASLSLRAIAREAGVSHTAPYYHFPDRKSLLCAVCERGLQMLRSAMEDQMARHPGDALRQIQAAGVAYVVFAMQEPHLFRLIFSIDPADDDANPELRKEGQRTFGVVRESVARLAAEKVIHVSAEELKAITVGAWAIVHGFAQLAIDGQFGRKIRNVERAARQMTSVYLTGVVSRTPGSSL